MTFVPLTFLNANKNSENNDGKSRKQMKKEGRKERKEEGRKGGRKDGGKGERKKIEKKKKQGQKRITSDDRMNSLCVQTSQNDKRE